MQSKIADSSRVDFQAGAAEVDAEDQKHNRKKNLENSKMLNGPHWGIRQSDGIEYGPYSIEYIRRNATEGKIDGSTSIRHEHATNGRWIPARQVQVLQDVLAPIVPPPIEPQPHYPPPSRVPPVQDSQNPNPAMIRNNPIPRIVLRRKKKESIFQNTFIQIVLGGLLAVPLTQIIIWHVMDKDVPWGIGPYIADYVPWIVPEKFYKKQNSNSRISDESRRPSKTHAPPPTTRNSIHELIEQAKARFSDRDFEGFKGISNKLPRQIEDIETNQDLGAIHLTREFIDQYYSALQGLSAGDSFEAWLENLSDQDSPETLGRVFVVEISPHLITLQIRGVNVTRPVFSWPASVTDQLLDISHVVDQSNVLLLKSIGIMVSDQTKPSDRTEANSKLAKAYKQRKIEFNIAPLFDRLIE
ncbi:MAG: hypothetical protein SGI77_04895 [Pirellulaceae bacterium]|nr:hypothetical protein [Pirellulaceae bacterium]